MQCTTKFEASEPYLNHKLPNHPMKNRPIIIPTPRQPHKILHRLRRCLRKQPQMDIPHSRMQNRRRPDLRRLSLHRSPTPTGQKSRLFILDIPFRLTDLFVIGKHIKADFTRARRHEHGIALLGLLEQGVSARSHLGSDDALALGGALVEREVQGAEGFGGAVGLDDAVGEGVEDFDAEQGAVEDEVAGFVEDDVGFGALRGVVEIALDGEVAAEVEVVEFLQGGAGGLHVG